MSAQPADSPELLTIDELAASVGKTVRTTRYYASLGLLPPPVRRGRVAYYDRLHQARLELVGALQDHGFTLQAIERFLAGLPDDASVEDLALQRAMLTSWSAAPPERLTRAELSARLERTLTPSDLELLVRMGSLQEENGVYLVMPSLQVGVALLDIDIPRESMAAAGDAIRRHMESLVGELSSILKVQVLEPFRREATSPEDKERLEQTMARLRQLTLEAIVAGFQSAANAVITRSLKGSG